MTLGQIWHAQTDAARAVTGAERAARLPGLAA
jgi:hypothetical protein